MESYIIHRHVFKCCYRDKLIHCPNIKIKEEINRCVCEGNKIEGADISTPKETSWSRKNLFNS